MRPAVEREKILARYAHFALWTEDADATAKRIEELGLPCRDVVSGPTGLRQVFVKDPDGNMVEFIGPTTLEGRRPAHGVSGDRVSRGPSAEDVDGRL